MIKEFVERFDANRDNLREAFKKYHERIGDDEEYAFDDWKIEYKDIVKEVVKVIHDPNGYSFKEPDPERIHEIDDGHYQGTLVYVIAASGYQPDEYWYVRVSYGSCSCCDALEYATSSTRTVEQTLDDIMLLALHIVQGMRKMGGEEV